MRRLLIRGGTLVDGTGAAPRRADVAIEGDRISDLPPPGTASQGQRVIAAEGMIVCPGFIDIHSHGDLIVTLPIALQRRLLEGRLRQGITTEIVGNCGLGVFPCEEGSLPDLRAVVSWMTPEPAEGWPGDLWSDLESYLDLLEAQGVWLNVGALQPHGPLRIRRCGLRPGPADAGECAAMADDLSRALDAGAFGLSTGLIYPPGIYTPTEEIVGLARVMGKACGGGGFVASHIRGSSEMLLPAVDELIQVGREAGVRVQHSHCEAVGREHWHKLEAVLEKEEAARRASIPVAFDMFPYTAAATMMLAIYPPRALQGGVNRLLQRLRDPESRAEIREMIAGVEPAWPPWTPDGWPHNLVRAVGWEGITVGSVATRQNGRFEGMTLEDLGRATGKPPFDAISDLMIEEGGRVSQIIHGISGEEGQETGLDTLISHPAGAICTDANDFGKGKPHPAAYGTFPRILSRFVRERGLLTLQAAIRKMTGYPAGLLGLADRGIVRPGAAADLVVFDPDRVASDATYADPRRPARGIAWVLINGRVVVGAEGVDEPGSPPGRVLRREG